MKTIKLDSRNSIEVTEKQYQKILTNYRRFFLNESKCSNRCPMQPDDNINVDEELERITGKKVDIFSNCIVCASFPEFKYASSGHCPCYCPDQNPFQDLKAMLIREGRL